MLGVILGGIITILITIFVENLRRPRLTFKIGEPVDRNYTNKPAKDVRFLGIDVINKPLPAYARWMTRNIALQCHGYISFHHLDGQNIFGRSMPIRWSYTIEGVPITIDVPPGEARRLDVAAKFDSEDDCYGWSNENYFSDPVWRHPDWKLDRSRYLVGITIYSAGEKCSGLFRLVNDVPQQDFRLEPAMPNDFIRE